MKRQAVVPKKKRGPPATGKGVQLQVRVQPGLLSPLDSFIATQHEPMTRPEAIRHLVRGHLIGLGYLKAPPDDPETQN